MARKKKTTRRKARKKTTRKKTTRRRAPTRRRGRSSRRWLRALIGISAGIVLGWVLVTWLRDAGEAPPTTAINVTARGEQLVEIPRREQVAALNPDERDRLEQQVIAALEDLEERVGEPAPGPGTLNAGGRIRGADERHRGSGEARLYRLAGGRHVLRLQDLSVTNGAALHVYLSEDDDIPRRRYVDLGRLKGNTGNQNYSIPSGVDPEKYPFVVIYCEVFERAYALAPLTP